MLRTTTSALVIGAGAQANDILSTITGLTDIVPSKAMVEPIGFALHGTPAADVTAQEVIIESEKDSDNRYRFFKGAATPLSVIFAGVGLDKPHRALSDTSFNPDHGLRLRLVGVNGGAGGYNGIVVWAISNQVVGTLPDDIDITLKRPGEKQKFAHEFGGRAVPFEISEIKAQHEFGAHRTKRFERAL